LAPTERAANSSSAANIAAKDRIAVTNCRGSNSRLNCRTADYSSRPNPAEAASTRVGCSKRRSVDSQNNLNDRYVDWMPMAGDRNVLGLSRIRPGRGHDPLRCLVRPSCAGCRSQPGQSAGATQAYRWTGGKMARNCPARHLKRMDGFYSRRLRVPQRDPSLAHANQQRASFAN
jgi:hypothetical protein